MKCVSFLDKSQRLSLNAACGFTHKQNRKIERYGKPGYVPPVCPGSRDTSTKSGWEEMFQYRYINQINSKFRVLHHLYLSLIADQY